MDASVKGLLSLWINVSLPNQAAEGGLDMGAGAAKTVVKVEMTESRIQVVPPQQTNHPAAQPNTLRITRRPTQNAGCLGDFVDLLLGFLGSVSRRLLRLFGRFAVATALRESRGKGGIQRPYAT